MDRRTSPGARARLIQLLGWLHLRRPLKRLYCRLLGPDGGIVAVPYVGHEMRFYVHRRAGATGVQDMRNLQGEHAMLAPMMDALRPGDCAWDVGAEIGLYSLYTSAKVGADGEIVAIEPAGDAFERLQDHLHLNRVRNVRAFRLALSDAEGTLELYREGTGYAPTLRNSAEILAGHTQVERVQVATGDGLRRQLGLRAPRAVKVDVEGAEYAALQGLRQTLAQPECVLLCCEIHPRIQPPGITPEAIMAWVRDMGFTQQEVKPRDRDTTHLIARKPAVS